MYSHRRQFLEAFALSIAAGAVLASGACAAVPSEFDRWAQNIADTNRDLSQGKITLLAWQDQIESLAKGLRLEDLKRYLDFDRLTSAMTFPSNLAETKDPKFPATINVAGIERPWFLRFFGMRKGGAIIPHVHNNMVSSHLVMSGSFHARTFDRIADLAAEKAILLRPRMDGALKPGEIISMSDDRDNSHWLIAEEDRSFTFDVGMVNLSKTRTYGLKANDYNMIFIDPSAKPEPNGLLRAPVITFEQCQTKFAP